MYLRLKIGFIMVLAVAIILATGYLSYNSLSSIVRSIHMDTNTDETLVKIKDITQELEKAEKGLRIYTIIGEEKHLEPYYQNIRTINQKISSLKKEHLNDSLYSATIDTLGYLIDEKIYVWNEILKIYRDIGTEYLPQKIDTLTQIDSITLSDTVLTDDKKNFLKRVFSKRKELEEKLEEKKDELAEKETQHKKVYTKINSQIDSIKVLNDSTNLLKEIKEQQLSKTSTVITRKLYDLIETIEKNENYVLQQKAKDAEQLSKETYLWIASFTIFGTFLALLALFILTRYLRKANQYQKALQESKKAAEELVKAKEIFIANVTHELRTPLNAISGFTEQLLKNQLPNEPYLQTIKFSADHLLGLVNDLLDYSKLQAGKLELKPGHYNLHGLLNNIIEMLTIQADKNNVDLLLNIHTEVPEIVFGDSFQLKQIVINLLSNAIKFSPGGEVNLNISSIKTSIRKFMLIIKVKDNGIGIDPLKLDHIFEDFTQEEAETSRNYGGTGLGLAIVKKLCELHQGDIKVLSTKSIGSEFTCTLPYFTGTADKVAKIKKTTSVPVLTDKNILVADDNKYNRTLLKVMFEKWGANVHEAGNGDEAINVLNACKIDYSFLDIRMPVVDGKEVALYIRNSLKLNAADMPVFIISAASISDTEILFNNIDINHFLQKPVTEDVVKKLFADDTKFIRVKNYNAFANEQEKLNHRININELLQLGGNDMAFVQSMLKNLVETSDQEFANLQKNLSEMDFVQIREIAHKLASPFRHIGADSLLNLLKKIEKEAANEKNGNVISSDIEQAVSAYKEIKNEIITLLNRS